MSPNLKKWIIGSVNAVISGAATGVTSLALGVGLKKGLIFVTVSAGVSLAKWVLQHQIPED